MQEKNQFGQERVAYLFMPGDYDESIGVMGIGIYSFNREERFM